MTVAYVDIRPLLFLGALPLVAVAAYLLIGVVPYAGSGLVAPLPGVIVLWALWLAGWWLVIRWLRTNPKWAWSVSLIAVLVWVGVVQLGAWLFDWSA